MAHILAKLTKVKLEEVKKLLKEHAPIHAKDGMYVERVWKNIDKKDEVFFIFKVDDLKHAKQVIKKTHAKTLKKNPKAKVPKMIFLEE